MDPASHPRASAPASEAARARLKQTALRLFSERGIDGVSVRDIVSAANMKNGASLHYYFGSKDALIRDLVVECAARSDAARLERLEQLEAAGGPARLADVVRLLIEAEASLEGGAGGGHMRFIMALQINHRDLVRAALEGGPHAAGYMRCVEYVRGFLCHLPPDTVRARIVFMYLYIMATLAAREAAYRTPGDHAFWEAASALDQIVETTCGLLDTADPPTKGLAKPND